LGRRTAKQVWDRQARWSRLRRITFASLFAPELLTGSILPIAAGAWAADAAGLSALAAAALLSIVWFGSEAVLARGAGWRLSWLSPISYLLRDAILPALWVQAWLHDGFEWRGNDVHLEAGGKMQPSAN
jgi:ceramide glucosyltransferase